jgi:alkanesulfonate monooxygenase SsuD/methylene tetrahydromethanopterin reductase-like flavin-dependent oxidoreductase (luciferase family)
VGLREGVVNTPGHWACDLGAVGRTCPWTTAGGASCPEAVPVTTAETARCPVGVAFTPFETRADVLVAVALEAERSGLAAVSVAEAMSLAAPVVLAELAVRTEQVELASGVLSVWSRTPAVLALTAAQLQQLSGGRFVLGLGASTRPLVEGFHGVAWERPLGRVREVAVAVRALLAGERLPAAATGARPLRLGVPPPEPRVPIALAAVTPASTRLAGAVADRWLPFLLPRRALDDGRELLARGAREVGRDDLASVTACVPLATGADEAQAAAVAATWLTTYCTRMGPVYPRVLREWGYGRELDALLEANTDPRRPVLPVAAERLAHEVLLLATHDEAAGACGTWQAAADRLQLVLPFGLPPSGLRAAMSAVAPAAAAG